MKTIQQLSLVMMLTVAAFTPSSGQEQKKYRILISTVENGTEQTLDTTFNTKAELDQFMAARNAQMPGNIEIDETAPAGTEGLHEINVTINGDDLTGEQKVEIRKELNNLKKELKSLDELKELDELKKIDVDRMLEELKDLKIEVTHEVSEENPTVVIRKVEVDDKGNKTSTIQHFVVNGEEIESDEPQVVIMKCDSLHKNDTQIKIIKMNSSDSKDNNVKVPEAPAVKPPVKKEENQPNDYELAVSDMKIYPNPTPGKITVSFKVDEEGPVQLRVIDGAGRTIINEEVNPSDGYFSKEYSIEGKARGTYLLQLKQGEKWRHEKIILR